MSENSPSDRRGLRTQLTIAVVFAVALAGAAGWMTLRGESTDPGEMLRQANACSTTDPGKAERLLERAIDYSPEALPEAQIALCRLLAKLKKWDSARARFEALDLRSVPSRFLFEFGELALAEGQSELAVAALNEVRRRKDQESSPALGLLIGEYRRRNNEREMLHCVREIAELDRGRPDWWWKLLEMLDARQLDAEYLSVLKNALQRELPARDLAEMRHRLTARLVEEGDAFQARQELERIIVREGPSPRSSLHQAAIERLEGDPAAALKTLSAALTETGENPGIVRLRALIQFDLGNFRAAIRDFEAEIERDPFDLTAHFKLSEAYQRLGELDLAKVHGTLSQEIREKRQKINKLSVIANRGNGDQQACLQLADLNRQLNNSRLAAFWEERAREISERDKHKSTTERSIPRN